VAALTAPLVAPRGAEPPLLPAVSVVVVVRSGASDGQGAPPQATTTTTTTYHAGVGRPTDGTRYELGSITKVFASLLLARAVGAGVVGLDTPVGELLAPPAAPLPPPHWPRVTLRHLATHTAGLPREAPGEAAPAATASSASAHPSAAAAPPPASQPQVIPVAAWAAALAGVRFRTPPGTRWAYSNFGAGLLGHALARAVGAPSFAAAVRRWVFVPAGMATASVADDGGGADAGGGGGALATPHDDGGWPVPPTAFTDATAAAGGARASAADMGAFGAFCLAAAAGAPPRGPPTGEASPPAGGAAPPPGVAPADAESLAAALRLTLPPQRLSATGRPIRPSGRTGQALGWVTAAAGSAHWHNGLVAGSAAAFILNAPAGVAVAVMASAAESAVVEDLGQAVYEAARRGKGAPAAAAAIQMPPLPATVAAGALDAVAGTYRFMGEDAVLTVARPGGGRAEQLWCALPGGDRGRLLPVDTTGRRFDVPGGGLRAQFVGRTPWTAAGGGGGGGGGGTVAAVWVSGAGLLFAVRCRRVGAAGKTRWWERLEDAAGGFLCRWARL